MEYSSTPLQPPASKTIVLQQHQPAGAMPANRPTDLTGAEVFLWLIVVVAVFMAPTWIAARGRRLSVGLVNVFFGVTGIGWIVALIMAVRSRENAK